jgi:hypothetical protein
LFIQEFFSIFFFLAVVSGDLGIQPTDKLCKEFAGAYRRFTTNASSKEFDKIKQKNER